MRFDKAIAWKALKVFGCGNRSLEIAYDSRMNLAGKKLLICEEALSDYKGHFYTWVHGIRKMHMDAGAEVLVAANRNVIPEIQRDIGAIPAYSVNSWGGAFDPVALRRYLRMFAHNGRLFRETKAVLEQAGPVDIVLFTATRVHHLLGLRALCAWGLGTHFQKLVVFLLTSQASYDDSYTQFHFKRSAQLIRRSIQSYAPLVKRGQVILAGDSHITCNEYETLAGVPMTLFPSPGEALQYCRKDAVTGTSARTGPIFTMLGVSTYDKGIDIFQAAILQFLEKFPDSPARFVLQWGVPTVAPDHRVIPVDERLREARQVTLFEKRLTDSEYAGIFAESDFIVLPYRKMTYVNRISGVAVEAACSGKPMIVTENTWLEWAMQEFGSGIAVPEDGTEELCAALEKCCRQRATLMELAFKRMKIANNYNSSERYITILWGNKFLPTL